MDGGVAAMEAIQVGQQKLAGHGVAGADGQVAHLQVTGLAQLGLAGLQQTHGAADIFIEDLALRGQGYTPGIPGEEPGLELPFQLLDGLADGRLGDVERLGSGGDVSGLGDLLEYLIELQLHRHTDTSLVQIMKSVLKI